MSDSTQLIPLTENDGVSAVMGRDLHKFLEVNVRYNDWLPRMVEYGFEEGKDYVLKNEYGQDSLGRRREQMNHILTLDMAKEISMIQRTDKGKQARQYFIECERQAKNPTINPATISRLELIQLAMTAETERLRLEEQNQQQAKQIEESAPKVDYHDTYVADEDLLSFRTVASTLNMKESALRELLIAKHWIYRETMSRWSETHGKKTTVSRYSEYAAKKPMFRRVQAHEAPRFRGEVMHTLKITPRGASAISRLVSSTKEVAA